MLVHERKMATRNIYYLCAAVCVLLAMVFVDIASTKEMHGCDDCVMDTECGEDDKCKCKDGFHGDPYFYCSNITADDFCSGNNDPVLITVKNENVVFHLIGSTLLTMVTTGRKTANQTQYHGECHFKMHGWTERVKGKFYFAGIQFDITQKYQDHEDRDVGFIYGDALAGKPYNYTVQLLGNVDSGKDDDGCGVAFRHITRNFMYGSAPCCGIYFAVRVYHPDFPQREPGYFFRVPKVVTHSFMDIDEVEDSGICLGGKGLDIDQIIKDTGIADRRLALTYHAATNSELFIYPGAPENLAELHAAFWNCLVGYRTVMMQRIDVLFNPRMVKCVNGIGKSVDKTVTAMLATINYSCNLGNGTAIQDACETLVAIVNQPECHSVGTDKPMVSDMQNLNCFKEE